MAPRLSGNRNGGNVRRSGQTVGCNQNEAGRSFLIPRNNVPGNKKLGAGAGQRRAARHEIAAQGNPGFTRSHYASAPFIVVGRGGGNVNRGPHSCCKLASSLTSKRQRS